MSADGIHANAIVVDAHSDVFCDVTQRRLDGEAQVLSRLHVPAWREGGVDAIVTTLYVDPEHKPDGALHQAVTLLGAALNDIEETPDVRLCRTRDEVDTTVGEGKIAFILAMEGGEPVQDGIESLRVFHELGMRILGLTWNQRNLLAEGVGQDRVGSELTELGKEMVAEANRLGILLDASHLTTKSFWDLLEVSEQPVIASHSNAFALCNHRRNLDDKQITALADSGGLIGICGVSNFINDDPKQASLDGMLDHIDHVVKLVGAEHVALGPDFVDYFQSSPSHDLRTSHILYPEGFETIARMPNVTAGLLERGYSEGQIRGILGLNFLRVFVTVCG